MYPNLFSLFQDLFGLEIQALRFVNTFGFFVAIAFFSAFQVLKVELKWKQSAGILPPVTIKKLVGKKPNIVLLSLYGLIGFVFGYKVIGIFGSEYQNSQEYMASSDGSWWGGIIISALFFYTQYMAKKKEQLPKPEIREFTLSAHYIAENFLLIALVSGFLGAKIFHNLENLDELYRDPIGALFSFSGLTFYGGLLCAAGSLYYYTRKLGLGIFACFDAIPVVMLAYGIGRLGCHFAGDGDWGIYNTDPNPLSWLPDWLWAYNYPNNVLGVVLEHPVFPTPLYEAIICIGLAFFLIWVGRKVRIKGFILGFYLFLTGVERLLIEQIRVNNKYTIGTFEFTQAELVSVLSIIAGLFLMYARYNRWKQKVKEKK